MRYGFVSGKMGLDERGQYAVSVELRVSCDNNCHAYNYTEYTTGPPTTNRAAMLDRAFDSVCRQDLTDQVNNNVEPFECNEV